MFGRKKCPRCSRKSGKKDNFCPECGHSFSGKQESFFEPSFKMGFPLNMILKQLGKQFEKEFNNIEQEIQAPPTFDDTLENQKISKEEKSSIKTSQPVMSGFSINISTSPNGQPVIRMGQLGKNTKEKAKVITPDNCQFPNRLTEKQAENFSKLPKEDPKTSVKRLTDRIVYEIFLPGIKASDLIISRMEKSIEVRAFTKEKAFVKLIPMSLPILSSQLEEGKLILELKPDN